MFELIDITTPLILCSAVTNGCTKRINNLSVVMGNIIDKTFQDNSDPTIFVRTLQTRSNLNVRTSESFSESTVKSSQSAFGN
eukprot:1913391-Karenia_brevis.AAC.1